MGLLLSRSSAVQRMSSFVSFFVRSESPFLRSLIVATNARTFFLADLLSRLNPFFCSTALQAFFRPDHRFPMPTRAEAVRAGRRSAIDGALRRFQARALTALSTAADWMKTGRKCPLVVECLLWFCSRELMSLPDPPFSTRSRVAGRNMALEGFDAAMSRTHST